MRVPHVAAPYQGYLRPGRSGRSSSAMAARTAFARLTEARSSSFRAASSCRISAWHRVHSRAGAVPVSDVYSASTKPCHPHTSQTRALPTLFLYGPARRAQAGCSGTAFEGQSPARRSRVLQASFERPRAPSSRAFLATSRGSAPTSRAAPRYLSARKTSVRRASAAERAMSTFRSWPSQ